VARRRPRIQQALAEMRAQAAEITISSAAAREANRRLMTKLNHHR
jgi:hypothetical protein